MREPYTPPSQLDGITDALVGAWPLWALLILAGLGLWQWTRRRITPAELLLHRYIRHRDTGGWEYGLADEHGNEIAIGEEVSLGDAADALNAATGHLGQEVTA